MMLVSAVIRPCRLGDVQQALLGIGAECVAVTQVEGFGRQKGHAVQYQGAEYLADSIPKVRIDAIVSDEMTRDVADALIRAARTNRIGDGKIFLFRLGAMPGAARNDASYDQRHKPTIQEKIV
jgi:nitrogen regulatory protein P-II 1